MYRKTLFARRARLGMVPSLQRWTLMFLSLCVMRVQAATLTKEDEKKAAVAVSDAADKWAASQKDPVKPPPTPASAQALPPSTTAAPVEKKTEVPLDKKEVPETAKPVAPPSTVVTAPPPTPVVSKRALNEMVGKIVAIENDPRVLRLALEGGYNIEFTYDASTVVTNGGSSIKAVDLYYGDKVQVRYAGKELKAVEIERLEKGPRAFAE